MGIERYRLSGFRLSMAGGAIVAVIAALLPAQSVLAQVAAAPDTVYEFNIPAGELAKALDAFSAQAGVQIGYTPELVAEKQARALRERLNWREGLGKLLEGSGLEYQQIKAGTVVVKRSKESRTQEKMQPVNTSRDTAAASGNATVTEIDSVTVTGTRIRGGATPSPVITIGSERIREEGFADLGEVIRSIPQNFSGGQNPGVRNDTGNIVNQNITGGSGLNLRGLGPDASLTLLNGRRLTYGGFVQGVDISAIPVEAVERIEIVADGASAIYGSDAVGGVANVILKQDFDGITLGVRHGNATDGGLTTREYTATAGTAWSSGGLIVALLKNSADPIYSDQRDYTRDMYDPSTLYQGSDLRSALLSAYQSLGNVTALRLDAFRTERESYQYTGQLNNYYHITNETTTSLASPGVEFSLPNDWTLTFGGTLGKDETISSQPLVNRVTGVATSNPRTLYQNESRSYEVDAEGPVFTLPGGNARLAIGAGYRNNDYLQRNLVSGAASADGDESSRFAYAEINLPLIGEDQGIRGVQRLALTGAVRSEDYDSFGGVTTPKFGLIYGPNADFTLKASWGKSFKAPTLLQQYQSRFAYIYPTTMFGATGYPANATALYLIGGNPDLDPERAETISASLAFHPEALPGLEMEVTWFDIDYTDRVVQPLIPTQALRNPIYSEFIQYAPTAAEQAEILAYFRTSNFSTDTYDASTVVAIVPNLYVNTTRQRVEGLDLSGSYRFDLGAGRMVIRGSASWLDSTQQLTSAQSAYDLAGTLFYPAKFSGRMGVVWSEGGLSISGFGNYKSGVTNTTDDKKTASWTTFDTTLRYGSGESNDGFSGWAFELSAQNLFDRAPPFHVVTSLTNAPYDSTNYSAVGRFLGIAVSKHW